MDRIDGGIDRWIDRSPWHIVPFALHCSTLIICHILSDWVFIASIKSAPHHGISSKTPSIWACQCPRTAQGQNRPDVGIHSLSSIPLVKQIRLSSLYGTAPHLRIWDCTRFSGDRQPDLVDHFVTWLQSLPALIPPQTNDCPMQVNGKPLTTYSSLQQRCQKSLLKPQGRLQLNAMTYVVTTANCRCTTEDLHVCPRAYLLLHGQPWVWVARRGPPRVSNWSYWNFMALNQDNCSVWNFLQKPHVALLGRRWMTCSADTSLRFQSFVQYSSCLLWDLLRLLSIASRGRQCLLRFVKRHCRGRRSIHCFQAHPVSFGIHLSGSKVAKGVPASNCKPVSFPNLWPYSVQMDWSIKSFWSLGSFLCGSRLDHDLFYDFISFLGLQKADTGL